MIRKENLEDMLKTIRYIRDAHKKIYEKRYAAFDCVIEVDFTGSGTIKYPEDSGFADILVKDEDGKKLQMVSFVCIEF